MIVKHSRLENGKYKHFPDVYLPENQYELAPGVNVSKKNGIYKLSAGHLVTINNQNYIGEKILSNLMVIEDGHDIFVVEDDEAEKVFLALTQDTEKKTESVSATESKYNPKIVKAMKDRHYKLFSGNGSCFSSLHNLSVRLVRYANIKLKWERAIILRIIENKGYCLIATGSIPKDFRIPRALTMPVWRKKTTQRFIDENARARGLEPTTSIMEGNIICAMIAPFFVNKKIVGILYVDSTANIIPDPAYFLLDHIVQKISKIIGEFLEFPELKELDI